MKVTRTARHNFGKFIWNVGLTVVAFIALFLWDIDWWLVLVFAGSMFDGLGKFWWGVFQAISKFVQKLKIK